MLKDTLTESGEALALKKKKKKLPCLSQVSSEQCYQVQVNETWKIVMGLKWDSQSA